MQQALFLRQGYAATTLDQIAAGAEVAVADRVLPLRQ